MSESKSIAGDVSGANVFISYSRVDREFARQIYLVLQDEGFNPLMDVQAINPAEPWQDRLTSMIEQCDTIVFIVSEPFLASEACAWEAQEALRMGKRMIPMLPGPLGDLQVPDFLSRLQYVHFYPEPKLPDTGFYDGTRKLARALRLNLEWLREARIYNERAGEWRADPITARLVKGALLKQAELWLESAPEGETIPDGVAEWIAESAKVENAAIAAQNAELRRRSRNARITFVTGLALFIAAIVGGWAAISYSLGADEANSRTFAFQANALANQSEWTDALLLALHGDPAATGNPVRRMFRPNGFDAAGLAMQRANARTRLLRQTTIDMPGITAAVSNAACDCLIVGNKLGEIALWSRSGEEIGPQIDSLGFQIMALERAPDGSFLVAAMQNGAVTAIDLETGEIMSVMDEHRDVPTSVAISADSRMVASVSDDQRAILWNPLDGQLTALPFEHEAALKSVAFAPGGFQFVVGAANGRAYLWSPDGVEPDAILPHGEGKVQVSHVSFTPDGLNIFTGGNTGGAKVWTISMGGAQLRDLPSDGGEIRAVRQAPGSGTIVVASRAGDITVWPPGDTKPVDLVIDGASNILDVQVSLDGRAIDVMHRSGLYQSWRTPGADAAASIFTGANQVFDIRANSDGGPIYAATSQGSVRAFAPDGEALGEWIVAPSTDPLSPHEVRTIATGQRGDAPLLVAGSTNGAITVIDLSRDLVASLPGRHTNWVNAVDVAPDGVRVAAASEDGTASLWSMENGEQLGAFTAPPVPAKPGSADMPLPTQLSAIRFTPDGSQLLIGTRDGRLIYWSPERGQEGDAIAEHTGDINAIAYSGDGAYFATASEDGKALLWARGSASHVAEFARHQGGVTAVAFSPDGRFLATAGRDNLVRLWPFPLDGNGQMRSDFLDAGNPLVNFEGHLQDVRAVQFSADGTLLISSGDDGMIRRWALPEVLMAAPAERVAMSCATLERLNVSGVTSRDAKAHPILRTPLIESPCPHFDDAG